MKTHRLLLPMGILALAGCVSVLKPAPGTFAPGSWSADPVVSTEYGLVEGSQDVENTWAWKGIPYALPPTGDLRWKAPRPPQPWMGIRKARRFGSSSAQTLPVLGATGSEDCLFLNVWRPRTSEASLPVYLFVHGGGNTIGASSFPDYYGYAVASRSNMVYVSINYRLGVFGWFHLPALSDGESAVDASGNYGTLDIIAALKWVKENIAAFGGDPQRVTIAGESAGAMNILSLLVSPMAEGLFQRAVVESGIAVMQSLETADKAAHAIVLRLLVRRGKAKDPAGAEAALDAMSNAEIRAFLDATPTADFLASLQMSPLGMGMADHPTIYADGTVLPLEGYAAFADGSYPGKVPLIIGSNKDEMKLFMFFGKEAKGDPDLYQALARYRTMVWRYGGVDSIAQKISAFKGQPPVYAYRFDWGSPNARGVSPLPGSSGTRLGAFHSIEIPFFLGTESNSVSFLTGPIFTDSNEPGRRVLTDAAMRYLAAFARTGNPNDYSGSPLPEWKPWDPAEGGTKALVMDVDGAKLAFSTLTDSLTPESIKAEASRELVEPLQAPASIDPFGLLK